MVEQLSDLKKAWDSIITDELSDRLIANHVEVKTVRIFCQGYMKDENGNPATEEDAVKKARDEAFIEAYVMRDRAGEEGQRARETLRPHFHKYVRDILDTQITLDMLDPSYLEHHAAELKLIADRMTYFENLKQQNEDFFNSIPLMDREMLRVKLDAFAGSFSMALACVCDLKGVKINSHKLYKQGKQFSRKALEDKKNLAMSFFKEALAAYPAQLNEAIARVNQQNGANAAV